MNQIKNFFAFKTVYSQNKTFLVFSISRKEEINYSQVQMLENEAYRDYILPFQCTKTASTNKISFDVSGLTSLSEYLKTEMRQEQYFEIISGIQKIISFCQKSYLSLDNLVCDTKYMYYHNTLKKILMLYIPVKNPHYIRDSIPDCLKKIHNSAKGIIITDGNYMNKYESYLERFSSSNKKNSTNSFSPDSLLHFFNENNVSKNESNNKEQQFKEPDFRQREFPISHQVISGEKGFDIHIPEPYKPPVEKPQKNTFSETIIKSNKSKVFVTDRCGNRFDILHFPFKVGRNNYNDLVINEGTVSGDHAVISENNGRYFIKDESSNGTYLNDANNRISYTEIQNGDIIYFESFPFVFSVEKINETSSTGTVMISRRRQPELADKPTLSSAAQRYQPEPSAVPDQKALAYLRREDGALIRIMNFPYNESADMGITIYTESTSSRTAIFVKNVSCNSLVFENSVVEYGAAYEIFSGCSLIINSVKYTFFVEN